MARKIQVVVDVQSDSVKFATDQTLTLTQQVRLLYKELQKVPEGTKEWTALQKAYNDTKDNLDKVSVKSKELFGTLSTLPGPVGDFSAKLQGGIDLLKVFSSFTLKDLSTSFKGVVGDIADIFSNLTRTSKGVQELGEQSAKSTTNLTEFAASAANVAASTKNAEVASKALKGGIIGLSIEEQKSIATTKGLTAANEELAVAEGTATVATGALKTALQILQATGILLIITAIVAAGKALYDFAFSTKKSEEATKAFNEALKEQERLLQNDITALDQGAKAAALRAKLTGKSEEEIYNVSKKFGEERLALLRKYDQDLYKDRELVNKNTVMATEDREKALTEINAKILKNGQDITKQISENELTDLQFRVKKYEDAKKAGEEFNKKEADRLKKELEDKKAQYKEDYAAYAGALKERRETTDSFYETEKYNLAKTRFETGMSEEEYNAKIFILNSQRNQAIADDEKNIYDARLAFLKQGLQQKLITQKEYDTYLIDLQREYTASSNALTKEGQDADLKLLEEFNKKQREYKEQAISINSEIKESWLNLGSSISQSISSLIPLFQQGSDLQKAFGIISVLINAASAIGKINLSAQEAQADFAKTIATGTATVASGVALLSNPITAAVGAAQVAAGKAAITTGTAGSAAVKANATRQIAGVGIVSAAQIAAILSAKKSGGAVAGGGAAGGGTPTTTFNGTVTVPAPVIGASQATQSGTLATTIAGAVAEGNSRSRPIQTYVIGDQVSTQQQLDRRISLAAKMGG